MQHTRYEIMQNSKKNMMPVYLILAIAVVVAWYVTTQRHSKPADLTDADAAAEMKQRSELTIAVARDEYHIHLDYSPESVERVETILASIHEQHLKSPLDHKQLVREALKWGGYVGECIRRMKDVHWEINSEVAGEGSFPIVFDETKRETFPVRWCYNRITNGPEDNVWVKFDLLIMQDINPQEWGAAQIPHDSKSE